MTKKEFDRLEELLSKFIREYFVKMPFGMMETLKKTINYIIAVKEEKNNGRK